MKSSYKAGSNTLYVKPDDMLLADDGTLDTVIECSHCSYQSRYNFDSWVGDIGTHDEDSNEKLYDSFVLWAKEDLADSHICYVIRNVAAYIGHAAYGIEFVVCGKVRGTKWYVRERARNESFERWTNNDKAATIRAFRNYARTKIEGDIELNRKTGRQASYWEVI